MKKSIEDGKKTSKKLRPASTPEGREKQLISLSYDAAEKQLIEGTASSAVIVHFLKMGSVEKEKELEKLEEENKLLKAKTKALEDAAKSEVDFREVLRAFRTYSGASIDEEDEC